MLLKNLLRHLYCIGVPDEARSFGWSVDRIDVMQQRFEIIPFDSEMQGL